MPPSAVGNSKKKKILSGTVFIGNVCFVVFTRLTAVFQQKSRGAAAWTETQKEKWAAFCLCSISR